MKKSPHESTPADALSRRNPTPSPVAQPAAATGQGGGQMKDLRLTKQEGTVIAMFVRGFGSSSTAKAMGLSLTRIKKLKRCIRAKMDARREIQP